LHGEDLCLAKAVEDPLDRGSRQARPWPSAARARWRRRRRRRLLVRIACRDDHEARGNDDDRNRVTTPPCCEEVPHWLRLSFIQEEVAPPPNALLVSSPLGVLISDSSHRLAPPRGSPASGPSLL